MVQISGYLTLNELTIAALDFHNLEIQSRCIKVVNIVTTVIGISVLHFKVTGLTTNGNLSTCNGQILFRIGTEVVFVNLL